MSYYKTIRGIRYDRALLEEAKLLTQGQGDGRISLSDMQQLVSAAQDGGKLTDTEIRTLDYISQHFKVTEKAREWYALQTFRTKDLDGMVRSILEGRLGLSGISWEIDPGYLARQEALDNDLDFAEALYKGVRGFLDEAESSTSLRDVLSMETDIDLEDQQEIEAELREWMKEATLYLVPLGYLAENESGAFPFEVSQWAWSVQEFWVFGLEIPERTDYLFLSQVRRERQDYSYPYSFGYLPGQRDYSTVVDAVIDREFLLEGLERAVNVNEAKAQRKLGGEVDFPAALRAALNCFLYDEGHPETPRRIVRETHGEVEPDDFQFVWSYNEWLTDKVRQYLDQGMIHLVDRTVYDLDHDELEEVFPPEEGEKVADNWIFMLMLPELSDHLYWAIVPRDGKRAYCYGFN